MNDLAIFQSVQRTSVLRQIVSHTGSRKARFTSLPFDSPTLYLNIYARNGNQIARRGCDFIRQPWSAEVEREYHERFSGAIERWLDAGSRLVCSTAPRLRRQSWQKRCVTLMVTESSQIAWVVMPNHVHAVFVLNPAWPLEKIILSWKGFTARKINPLLGRKGSLWQRDYFDRLVRDAKHFANCIRYIRRNPDKGASPRQANFLLYESELARSIE